MFYGPSSMYEYTVPQTTLTGTTFSVTGFSGVTADQWKAFITVYARPCMYKLLSKRAYKCMVKLAEIVSIVISPAFNDDMITQLHRLLHEHHRLFRHEYGKWEVSVNYHMVLHLPDIIADLGPPHNYWCFGYERLNGVLAGVPNSNRNVEVEVANRFIRDACCSFTDTPNVDPSTIPPALTEFVHFPAGSDDNCHIRVPWTFWVLRTLNRSPPAERLGAQLALDSGDVQNWPLNLLKPQKLNVLMQLSLKGDMEKFFRTIYGRDPVFIKPRVDKFGRCQVNGIMFASNFHSSDRGNIVKTLFVNVDNEFEPFFGIIKFFFKATVVVQNHAIDHELAYVDWYKCRGSGPDPESNLYIVTNSFYQAELSLLDDSCVDVF